MSEPVAFEYQHEETGVIGYIDQWQIDNGFFDNNPRLQLIGPLYRHPPKADELEVELSDMRESLQLLHDIMLMGGFDCPELDQAKALLPTPPDTGEKP